MARSPCPHITVTGPVRQLIGRVAQAAEFDVQRARHVTGVVLVALPHVDDSSVRAASGPTSSMRRLGLRVGAPGRHAAVELTGELFVADAETLPHELGAVLVVVEDEDERPVGVDEPAQPAREHGPQLDRQRARDVPGRERVDRTDVDDQRAPLEQVTHFVDVETRECRERRVEAGPSRFTSGRREK